MAAFFFFITFYEIINVIYKYNILCAILIYRYTGTVNNKTKYDYYKYEIDTDDLVLDSLYNICLNF